MRLAASDCDPGEKSRLDHEDGSTPDAAGVEELDDSHALFEVTTGRVHVKAEVHATPCAQPQVRRTLAALRTWMMRIALAVAACAAWALGPASMDVP